MLTVNGDEVTADRAAELLAEVQNTAANDEDRIEDTISDPDEYTRESDDQKGKSVNTVLNVHKCCEPDFGDMSVEGSFNDLSPVKTISSASVKKDEDAESVSDVMPPAVTLADDQAESTEKRERISLSDIESRFMHTEDDMLLSSSDKASATGTPADAESWGLLTKYDSESSIAPRYGNQVEVCRTECGTLYSALDAAGKPVFVKILDLDSLISWKAKDYFKREAEVIAGIQGEGIPEFIESFEEKSKSYLVMSYTAAPTLAKRMKSGKCADYAQAAQMLRHLAEILVRLSENAIVHRNINPENVRVDDDMNVMLFEFGKSVSLNSGIGGMDFMSDPTKYTAPEVNYGKASAASDIYSAGLTVLSWLTAKRAEDMAVDFMNIDVKAEIPADLPEWFGKLLIGMTEYEEQRRIQHAAQIIECIEANYP